MVGKAWFRFLLGISLLILNGCTHVKKSTGELGASDVKELMMRFKSAFLAEDVEAMRSIYVMYVMKVDGLGIQIGSMQSAEEHFPVLFELRAFDAQLIEVPEDQGFYHFDYIGLREPVRENGFSPLSEFSCVFNTPYKILLIGRRKGAVRKELMEIDVCLGVMKYEGRYYLMAADPVLEEAAEWVRSGRAVNYLRPPGHGHIDAPTHDALENMLKRGDGVPKDYEPIVRPRQEK